MKKLNIDRIEKAMMLFFVAIIVVAGGYFLFSNKKTQDSVKSPVAASPSQVVEESPPLVEEPPLVAGPPEPLELPKTPSEKKSKRREKPAPTVSSLPEDTLPAESSLVAEVPEPTVVPESEPEVPLVAEEPSDKTRLALYLGAGLDFSSFEQAGPEGLESGKFTSVSYPSLSIGALIYLTDLDTLELQYSRWPGKINSGSATVSTSSFVWTSYSAEYQRLVKEQGPFQYSVLLGLQQHQTPFLSSGDDLVDVLSNEFFNASVGLKVNYLADNDLNYEAFMRYQHPLSAKSTDGHDFSVSSPFIFDGSLGVSKNFGERLKAGVYWFGQYQNYNYQFSRDGNDTSGKETMLNSNIQLRLTWEVYGLFSVVLLSPLGRYIYRSRSQRNRKVVIPDKVDELYVLLWWAAIFTFFAILLH